MPRRRARVTTLAALPVAALTLAACTSGSGPGSAASSSSGSSAATETGARVANVTITAAKGCTADATTLAAGGVTFKVTNKDATAVSEIELLSGERIIGEKENLPAGFSGEFAVTVTAGAYTLYCPGAATERSPIKVTGLSTSTNGDSTVAAALAAATKNYATYVNTQVAALLVAAKKLDATLHGSSLTAAQAAYMESRPFYEKIEPVAESFVNGKDNLDADIDVRIGDTTFAQWRGFHRIEYGLFKMRSLAGLAGFGDKLVADVGRLVQKTSGLRYQPTELANGAQELLDEVASSKITGEEEAYSGIDLLDFANNDEGAEQAFAQLQPALAKIDATLATTIQTRFTALDKLVDSYRTGANPSGFKLYNELTQADKVALAAAVKAVAEPLSQVGSKVANA